jgi:peroxiredoxin Q/BCP
LADVKEEARKAFAVPRGGFGLLPGRVTYILDASGKCVQVYDNLLDAASHVDKAIEALEGLKKK